MIHRPQFSLLLLGLVLAGLPIARGSEALPSDDQLIRRVADRVVRETTRQLVDRTTGETFSASSDLPLKPSISIESKFNAWFYQTWLLTDGMRRVASALDEAAYRDFGERNLEFISTHLPYFERQHRAGMKAAPVGDGALSPIGFYFSLTELWHTGLAPLVAEQGAAGREGTHRAYLERVETFLAGAPRLPDGTFYRRRGRLMGDDPYMTVAYLIRLHRAGVPGKLAEAVQQVVGTHQVLVDPTSRLYRHGWEVKTSQPVGEFWGRVNGWMMLAQIDLLAELPPDHPRRNEILALFRGHAAALRSVQDADGGWHQLLDEPGTWIETSSTGMFVYGLARGLNEGWLDASFLPTALAGWKALKTKVTADGDVIDVCGSTDVGDRAYYRNRPRLSGDLHGFGPFLLGGAEIARLRRAASAP